MNSLQLKSKTSILEVCPQLDFIQNGPESEDYYYCKVEGYEIYLHDLELQIFKNNKEEVRWEIYEFNSEDQMVEAFTAEIKKRLIEN